jgi:cellulose synthase/poly-beta-1,6-N-acetylglucosamine synthase-like glycosyltransferase
VVAGNEFVDPVNPFFIHNGVRGSNVRAFFGTIYINASMIQFVLVVLAVSAVHYLVKLWAVATRSIYVNVLYFFYGGMLLMGWFEIYFYHLQFFEQPFMIFVIYIMMKIGFKKNNSETLTAENCERDGSGNTQP